MKELIFNKNNYNSYQDFYHDLYEKLDGKSMIDWIDYPDLGANLLFEFLWYNNDLDVKYIFTGFNLEKIKNYKTFDNYQYNLIFQVFEEFVKQYPNNSLEFKEN